MKGKTDSDGAKKKTLTSWDRILQTTAATTTAPKKRREKIYYKKYNKDESERVILPIQSKQQ